MLEEIEKAGGLLFNALPALADDIVTREIEISLTNIELVFDKSAIPPTCRGAGSSVGAATSK